MSHTSTSYETAHVSHQEQLALAYEQREAALRDLLDPPLMGEPVSVHPNYEYAKDSGLIDMFYFDPQTGEDGLRHMLEGDIIIRDNGSREVSGFHHEPSARHPETFVDYNAIAGRSGRALRDYRQHPFAPYNAHVVIRGYEKSVLHTDEHGDPQLVSAKSSMFPKEYDPLAIMQAAKIALETRDKRNDEQKSKRITLTEGFAPMLDGEHSLKLRFFLDSDTEKVITAFPLHRSSSAMKLAPSEVAQHLGL